MLTCMGEEVTPYTLAKTFLAWTLAFTIFQNDFFK